MKKNVLLCFLTLFSVVTWAQNQQSRVLMAQSEVLFKTNESKLTEKSVQTLEQVAQQIAATPNAEVTLKGSTDLDGSDAFNQALSERRVASVRDFLKTKGIDDSKFAAQAIGEAEAQNAVSSNEKAKKRSVVIEIWRVETPPPSITAVPKPAPKVTPAPKPQPRILETETERQTERERVFGNVFQKMNAPIQKFTISTAAEAVIAGESGTKITIPTNAFAGVPAGANVEFTLREYYSYSSMIAGNLTTKSGNELLQTGGMLFTEATYNGKPVALQQPIQIEFSSDESRLPNMQIFTGKRDPNTRGTIDWHATNQFAKDSLELAHGFDDFSFNNHKNVFFYEEIQSKSKKKRSRVGKLPRKEFFLPAFSPENNYAPMTFEEAMDTTGCAQLLYEYYELKANQVTTQSRCAKALFNYLNFIDYDRVDPMTVKNVHRNTFKTMYKFYNVKKFAELEKVDGAKWTALQVEQSQKIRAAKQKTDQFNESMTLAFEARQRERMELAARPMTAADSMMAAQIALENQLRDQSKKAFTSLNLGYINVDRFQKLPPESVLAIDTKVEAVENDLVQSYLILPKYRGVLMGKRVDKNVVRFDGIPQGVFGKVVHVKYENNKCFVAVKSLRTKKNMQPVVAEFQEIALENLASELNAM